MFKKKTKKNKTENSKALCVFLLKIQSVHVCSFSCPQYLNLSEAIHRITQIFSKENIFENRNLEYFILAVR